MVMKAANCCPLAVKLQLYIGAHSIQLAAGSKMPVRATGDDAAGRKRKSDSVAGAVVSDAPERSASVSKIKRSKADVKGAGKAARQLHSEGNGVASADGTIAKHVPSAMLRPGAAASHEVDTDSGEDETLPSVVDGSRAEQSFLDEVLEASRGREASACNSRGGKQKHADRSGVVKVIDVVKTKASKRSRPDQSKGSKPQAGNLVLEKGPKAAVRGKSAAQLLTEHALGIEDAGGPIATAWD